MEATKLTHFGKDHLSGCSTLTHFCLIFSILGVHVRMRNAFLCVFKVLVQSLIFIGLVPSIDLVKYFYFSARIFSSAQETIAF